jgi:hypothetical protein
MFRNRVINGDMRIDQRNNGSAQPYGNTTVAGNYPAYSLDRWWGQSFSSAAGTGAAFTIVRDSDAPAGFTNSLLVTVTTARASLDANSTFRVGQFIEGFNVADLGWGSANAQPATVSFEIKCSLTGTFGGAILNSAEDRSYPFTFSISAPNTWERKTVTIPGDTTGTWLKDNGAGLRLFISLGAGSTFLATPNQWQSGNFPAATGQVNLISTAAATMRIAGVQLEAGSVASSFERRPYGMELALCQRYFEAIPLSGHASNVIGIAHSTSQVSAPVRFSVPKRADPAVTLPPAGQTSGQISFVASNLAYPSVTGSHTVPVVTPVGMQLSATGYAGLTQGNATTLFSSGATSIQVSAEI